MALTWKGLHDLPPVGGSPLIGHVAEFDEDRGLGIVEYGPGRRLPFHCTAITDGSRRIEDGTVVAFVTAAGPSRPAGGPLRSPAPGRGAPRFDPGKRRGLAGRRRIVPDGGDRPPRRPTRGIEPRPPPLTPHRWPPFTDRWVRSRRFGDRRTRLAASDRSTPASICSARSSPAPFQSTPSCRARLPRAGPLLPPGPPTPIP